jgi:hypothetical protein
MRVTPSLPKRGRQHAGSIPLPPSFSEDFINLLMIIAIFGDVRVAGAEARCGGAPKGDCLSLSRISHENLNNQI